MVHPMKVSLLLELVEALAVHQAIQVRSKQNTPRRLLKAGHPRLR